MEQLEEAILGVLDGLGADDEMLLFIYPTNSAVLFDVELRFKQARARFEVLCDRPPMVSLVENRRFNREFVRLFQQELMDALY